MSTERDRDFEHYLEYQRAQRDRRVETLGGVATVLVLATFDLGLTGAGNPPSEFHIPAAATVPEVSPTAEASELRAVRRVRLAEFAAENAELGYAAAA